MKFVFEPRRIPHGCDFNRRWRSLRVKVWRCWADERAMASIGGAFGGNRGLTPIPPEKGVFPLDHLHECDETMKTYMACLRANNYDSEKCRQLSKVYLECRMEKNLMARQDLKELGFKHDDEARVEAERNISSSSSSAADRSREKVRGGFVSGIPRSAGSSR